MGELERRNPSRSLWEIGHTWALLLAALALAHFSESWLLNGLLFIFVATRQYALMILMHDGFHGHLARSANTNDFLGQFLLSFPLGSVFDVSRRKHLAHHKRLGHADDPDYVWYRLEEVDSLVGLFRHLGSIPTRQVSYTYSGRGTGAKVSRKNLIWVVTYQLTLLGLFALSGNPLHYFLFWVGPLFLAVLLDKFRSFCEHTTAVGEIHDDPMLVRTFRCSPIEKFFFAPFDMNFHAEHHRRPNIPHYHLSGAGGNDLQETSYLKVLFQFLGTLRK